VALTHAPALVALGGTGAALARRLAAELPGAEVHVLAGRDSGGPDHGANFSYTDFGPHLRALFRAGRPIVGLCASGILVRALAPLITDKRREPPVLAVAEDGGAVVPLLGGHHGGNALALRIGVLLDVVPALTTASERRFGVALDDPPPGYRLANPEDCKAFTARLLAGESLCVEGEAPWLDAACELPRASAAALTIEVSEAPRAGSAERLVYHPRRLALGVGCERGVEPAAVADLVRDTFDRHQLAAGAIAGVFSLDLKRDETAITSLAELLGVPARYFDAVTLEAQTPRVANPSEVVCRAVGCHSVAEAAALAAAGEAGELLVAKTRAARVTCAVARAPEPLDAARIGRGRGLLAVVGIGPGDALWRTAEADRLIASAGDLVGFDYYLDLLGAATGGKTLHRYPIGAERERVRAALALADEGRDVALICSGDAGIYAMAALVFEEIERNGDGARVPVRIAPGVSAMQAAAARVGAPLGHDFCAISLSDLLTPWEAIVRRLRAAAEADFVVALYNPASLRRRRQLAEALAIFAAHRAPHTPVVVARQLGRADETVTVTTLAELAPAGVDMRSVLLIGSTRTRTIAGSGRVYTPRGYAEKSD